jgi:hypothetical protein
MLREFVQAIKHLNVSIVVTNDVYKNQDIRNGEGVWIVNDATRFSLSHIALLSKLKLKDKKDSKNVLGILMKVEAFKTRFTQPYQNVSIEVPYETGMDPYTGLVDVAKKLGVLTQKGAYYYLPDQDKGWQMKEGWDLHKAKILELCEEKSDEFLDAGIDDSEIDTSNTKSAKSKRDATYLAENEE